MSKAIQVQNEVLIGFVVAHMIETLLYEDKLNVMDYLYSLDTVVETGLNLDSLMVI